MKIMKIWWKKLSYPCKTILPKSKNYNRVDMTQGKIVYLWKTYETKLIVATGKNLNTLWGSSIAYRVDVTQVKNFVSSKKLMWHERFGVTQTKLIILIVKSSTPCEERLSENYKIEFEQWILKPEIWRKIVLLLGFVDVLKSRKA